MKILYLYAEVMGYTMATIKELSVQGAEVHVVHWDKDKLTPYKMTDYLNVNPYPRSGHSLASLRALAQKVEPDITVVSGWQDKTYLGVALWLRKQGKVVVCGFDDQWHGTLKQYLAAVLGLSRYFTRYFSHAWVAGVYQYEYARKLGFRKQEIIFDLYSADLTLFHRAYQKSLARKTSAYPHRFLFVGRFEPIKGLDTLLGAWQQLTDHCGDWELHLIGNGSLKDQLAATPGVVVKDFMQPDKLVNEISETGCFILPSRGEPWGVVVHEFAAAGLPLIVSDVVGATTSFLVPGMNGFHFNANDISGLASAMKQIIRTADIELANMGHASNLLSTRITPETSAKYLLSLCQN